MRFDRASAELDGLGVLALPEGARFDSRLRASFLASEVVVSVMV